jgi:hypothetical protein
VYKDETIFRSSQCDKVKVSVVGVPCWKERSTTLDTRRYERWWPNLIPRQDRKRPQHTII